MQCLRLIRTAEREGLVGDVAVVVNPMHGASATFMGWDGYPLISTSERLWHISK